MDRSVTSRNAEHPGALGPSPITPPLKTVLAEWAGAQILCLTRKDFSGTLVLKFHKGLLGSFKETIERDLHNIGAHTTPS